MNDHESPSLSSRDRRAQLPKMTQNPTEVATIAVPIQFHASYEISEVKLIGSWDNWSHAMPMCKAVNEINLWKFVLHLPPGQVWFRFLCDSHWVTASNYDMEDNGHGGLNNTLLVEQPPTPPSRILSRSASDPRDETVYYFRTKPLQAENEVEPEIRLKEKAKEDEIEQIEAEHFKPQPLFTPISNISESDASFENADSLKDYESELSTIVADKKKASMELSMNNSHCVTTAEVVQKASEDSQALGDSCVDTRSKTTGIGEDIHVEKARENLEFLKKGVNEQKKSKNKQGEEPFQLGCIVC